MHWFATQLSQLNELADAYLSTQQQSETDIVNLSEEVRIKRSQFTDTLQELVSKITKIKGISGCAAYHDGLILISAGKVTNIEALGAMVQESFGVARKGSDILKLGDIQQIVIIGEVNKIAMLSIGPILLCISSNKNINLATVLS